eukprot:1137998-Pelagomonas_calceolata.AAC.3
MTASIDHVATCMGCPPPCTERESWPPLQERWRPWWPRHARSAAAQTWAAQGPACTSTCMGTSCWQVGESMALLLNTKWKQVCRRTPVCTSCRIPVLRTLPCAMKNSCSLRAPLYLKGSLVHLTGTKANTKASREHCSARKLAHVEVYNRTTHFMQSLQWQSSVTSLDS